MNLIRISLILFALITITLADCTICNCRLQDELETISCKDHLINFPKFKSSAQRIEMFNQNFSTLSNSFFKNLQSLQTLHMPYNQIENIAEDTFQTLQITELDLSHNQITDLKVRTFQHLAKIRILELNHNQIETIPNGLFRNLEFLFELHLEHNNISVIEENAFGNNFGLNYLNLGHNLLKRLNINLGPDLNSLSYLELEANPWTCNCENKNLITNLLYIESGSACTEPNSLYNKPYSSLTEDDFNCNTSMEINQNLVIVQEHNLTVIDCELLYVKSFISWTDNNNNFTMSDTKLNKTKEIRLPIKFYQIYKCNSETIGEDFGKDIVLVIDKNISILNVNVIIQLIYKKMDEKLICELQDKPDLFYDKETIIIDFKSKYRSVYSLILRKVNSKDMGAFACGVNNFETRIKATNTEQMVIKAEEIVFEENTERMLMLEEKIDFEENIYIDPVWIEEYFWIIITAGVTTFILIVIIVGAAIVWKINKTKGPKYACTTEILRFFDDLDSLSDVDTATKPTSPFIHDYRYEDKQTLGIGKNF